MNANSVPPWKRGRCGERQRTCPRGPWRRRRGTPGDVRCANCRDGGTSLAEPRAGQPETVPKERRSMRTNAKGTGSNVTAATRRVTFVVTAALLALPSVRLGIEQRSGSRRRGVRGHGGDRAEGCDPRAADARREGAARRPRQLSQVVGEDRRGAQPEGDEAFRNVAAMGYRVVLSVDGASPTPRTPRSTACATSTSRSATTASPRSSGSRSPRRADGRRAGLHPLPPRQASQRRRDRGRVHRDRGDVARRREEGPRDLRHGTRSTEGLWAAAADCTVPTASNCRRSRDVPELQESGRPRGGDGGRSTRVPIT